MKNNSKKILDYRNTSYKILDYSIDDKKIKFIEEFKIKHPDAWDIYSYVKSKENLFNKKFRSMYHDKCIYCGISTQVINSSNFEVDHVIPKAVLKLKMHFDTKEINGIGNLVNSCKMCNRAKWDYICDPENIIHLHPDRNKLHLIYNRNSDFSIGINEKYERNPIIKEFYEVLKLDNQLRRLDYLIMEMKDFCDIYEGEPIINEIQRLISKIEDKRRINY